MKKENEIKKCDLCGKKFTTKHYFVYDENYKIQLGLIHCGCIFEDAEEVLYKSIEL
jgi:hypothetical protein